MIQADIDASLRSGEPLLESLDDGFSPPPQESEADSAVELNTASPAELGLGPKSPF